MYSRIGGGGAGGDGGGAGGNGGDGGRGREGMVRTRTAWVSVKKSRSSFGDSVHMMGCGTPAVVAGVPSVMLVPLPTAHART